MRPSYPRSLALAVAAITVASAAQAQYAGKPYLVARSGELFSVGVTFGLFHDCRSSGATQVNVILSPQHGEVLTGPGRTYPTFPLNSPYAACNKHKVAGTNVYYRSTPGYVGFDRFVVEDVHALGNARRFAYVISVR